MKFVIILFSLFEHLFFGYNNKTEGCLGDHRQFDDRGCGYDLGAASGQIAKVEQKWANMVKSYKKWFNESNMTGSGADVLKNAPPFIKEVGELICNYLFL